MFFRSKPKKVEEKLEYVRTENPLLRPKKKDTTSVDPQVAEVVSDVSPTTPTTLHEKGAVPKEIQPQTTLSTGNNVLNTVQNASANHLESPIPSTGEVPENNPAKPKRQ